MSSGHRPGLVATDQELMALSAFALADGVVHHTYSSYVRHTYSSYDRGTDVLNTAWALLDRSPQGRDVGAGEGCPRRHD